MHNGRECRTIRADLAGLSAYRVRRQQRVPVFSTHLYSMQPREMVCYLLTQIITHRETHSLISQGILDPKLTVNTSHPSAPSFPVCIFARR